MNSEMDSENAEPIKSLPSSPPANDISANTQNSSPIDTANSAEPRDYFLDSAFDLSQRTPRVPEIEDSDSEDDFLDGDSVLSKLRTITNHCTVEDRGASSDENIDPMDPGDNDDDQSEPSSPIVQQLAIPNVDLHDRYCLDSLLVDKQNRDDIANKLARIEQDKERMRQGMDEDSAGELQPEQKQVLQSMEVTRQAIRHEAPGEAVFDAQLYGRFFTCPGNLTLQACGLGPLGHNYLEKQLLALPPDLAVDMLSDKALQICLPNFMNPAPVLTWTLYVMSVHSSAKVVRHCYALLVDSLSCIQWTPTFKDVLRIFVNYGCSPSKLGATNMSTEMLHLNSGPNHVFNMEGDLHGVPRQYRVDNLCHVIRYLGQAIKQHYKIYPSHELEGLITMVITVAMDTRLMVGCAAVDSECCLSVLLNAIAEHDWPSAQQRLCVRLAAISYHHHNQVFIVKLCPPVPRGYQLSRSLSLVMLKQLLTPQQQNIVDSEPRNMAGQWATEFSSPKVYHVLEVLHGWSLRELTQFYLASSIVSLIDTAVGNEVLKASETKEFERLISRMEQLRGEIRESVNVLDRTIIKDKVARLCSKWRFMLQSMGIKQSTLHEWFEGTLQKNTPQLQADMNRSNEDEESNS